MTNTIQNRYDFVLLFDVQDGNPNGDPDAGNMPRVDAQTGKGLVTDVCLKRKIRNYVGLKHGEQPPYEIYVKEKAVLNSQHARGYIEVGAENELETNDKGYVKSKGKSENKDARQWMCKNFYDVRTFGAVMSTGVNCGQVRGPIQMTFSRSVDPIVTLEHALTVCAARKDDKPVEEQIGIQGRKFTVPYGLYCAHGFVSAPLAAQTGFSEDDLALLWESLNNMFEHDRSAARGLMSTRKLVVFKHESNMGNAPAHVLLKLKEGITAPRSFADYDVQVDSEDLPNGVSILEV